LGLNSDTAKETSENENRTQAYVDWSGKGEYVTRQEQVAAKAEYQIAIKLGLGR